MFHTPAHKQTDPDKLPGQVIFNDIPMRERIAVLFDIPSDVSPEGERMLAAYGIIPCPALRVGYVLMDGERRVAHTVVAHDGWRSIAVELTSTPAENMAVAMLGNELGLEVTVYKSTDERHLYHAHGVVR